MEGDGFGDLALLNDKPRAATIMTTEPSELARIEKEDYNRILKFLYEREMKERYVFLKRVKQFEAWSDDSLKMIAGLYQTRHCKVNEIIIKESEQATHLFIVFAGKCQALRNVDIPGEVRAECFKVAALIKD